MATMYQHHSPFSSLDTTSLHFLPKQNWYSPEKLPILSRRNNHRWRIQITASKSRHFPFLTSAFERFPFWAPKPEKNEETTGGSLSDVVGKSAGFPRSVFPGGCWWSLPEHDEAQFPSVKRVTVWFAVRQMWELVGDDRWILFVAFGALIFAAISEISMPGILTACIFSAQRGEAMVFYRNSQLLLLLCLVSGISSGLRVGCFAIANVTMVRRMRETVYSVIICQDISFYDREAVGDLTSRLGVDCQRLSNVIGNDINLIFRNILQGTGALVNLLMLSWPLALSAVVICSVLSITFRFYGWYQKHVAKLTQDFTAAANEVAQETLSLIRTVRIYGAEENERIRLKHWLDKIAFIAMRESGAYGIWSWSFITLYRSTQVIAVLLGGMSILSGNVSPEQLTKYVLYCEWLIYATWRVTDNVSSLMQSVGASEKVFQLMNLVPSSHFPFKGQKLQRIMGHIQFVNVSFHYPSRPKVPVLDSVNISVKANEVLAIVGPSGSGKSTLINLLLGLYVPISGQIYLDGFPLRGLDIRWLREKIGVVEQEPHLFHMDIKSNIKYGCSRGVKQEDIEWAARQAHAHDFISSLPDGYETLVDDKLLSGGQKQRIAIARAILRDPSILILDEATSALDSESEHYVKGVIHAFRNDRNAKRTVIVIAHRFSTIKVADRIVVMDSGRVIEVGNHTELILNDGLYAKLIRTQTDGLA
ncbi:ABC transporter B family member 26, chloroplastic [Morus notabilis]|uniref:ABC transporter B family member 26, chloroplastic n=1 Tax=Morus notabilis TaxID=981085 RepID=UPI000CED10FA|nr:ABC transporter B family member 26, chloroplastic [Morus notabilis]